MREDGSELRFVLEPGEQSRVDVYLAIGERERARRRITNQVQAEIDEIIRDDRQYALADAIDNRLQFRIGIADAPADELFFVFSGDLYFVISLTRIRRVRRYRLVRCYVGAAERHYSQRQRRNQRWQIIERFH